MSCGLKIGLNEELLPFSPERYSPVMGELGVLGQLGGTLGSAPAHLSLQQSSWDVSLLLPSEWH